MVHLSFSQISERINKIILPAFDLVVGIAEGGVVPASLIAHKLGAELNVIRINYRNVSNTPIYEQPKILYGNDKVLINKRILIVDDVSVSGKTLATAVNLFESNLVSTLTLKGKADYVLFPEISDCVDWPWKLKSSEVFD